MADFLISNITVDDVLQPRKRLNEKLVEELKEAGWFPPVKVARVNGVWTLLDGHHRLQAAQELGWEHIEADVLDDMTDLKAWQVAFELNARNGQPLSHSDKKRHAKWLLDNRPQLSDREIARLSYLAPATIGYMRRGEKPSEARERRREGKGPKTYPLNELWERVESVTWDDFLILLSYMQDEADIGKLNTQKALNGLIETVASEEGEEALQDLDRLKRLRAVLNQAIQDLEEYDFESTEEEDD